MKSNKDKYIDSHCGAGFVTEIIEELVMFMNNNKWMNTIDFGGNFILWK